MDQPEFCVGLSTAADGTEAEKIAQTLVEEQLAACVNIVPNVRSIYKWQGAIERQQEWLLVIKTRRSRTQEVARRIQQLHSYEVPEAIFLDIQDGAESYLSWLRTNSSAD